MWGFSCSFFHHTARKDNFQTRGSIFFVWYAANRFVQPVKGRKNDVLSACISCICVWRHRPLDDHSDLANESQSGSLGAGRGVLAVVLVDRAERKESSPRTRKRALSPLTQAFQEGNAKKTVPKHTECMLAYREPGGRPPIVTSSDFPPIFQWRVRTPLCIVSRQHRSPNQPPTIFVEKTLYEYARHQLRQSFPG